MTYKHTYIYTRSLHDALPILSMKSTTMMPPRSRSRSWRTISSAASRLLRVTVSSRRSEEHTYDVQAHLYLHSFPTRRSSDLVDEVHHDDAAEVAQPQLADDLLGRLQVVAGDRLLQ